VIISKLAEKYYLGLTQAGKQYRDFDQKGCFCGVNGKTR
jgi:hypothetical protein